MINARLLRTKIIEKHHVIYRKSYFLSSIFFISFFLKKFLELELLEQISCNMKQENLFWLVLQMKQQFHDEAGDVLRKTHFIKEV
jgi:hypothetical protein